MMYLSCKQYMISYLHHKAGLGALAHDRHAGIVGLRGHPRGGGACRPEGPHHPLPVQISSAALLANLEALQCGEIS